LLLPSSPGVGVAFLFPPDSEKPSTPASFFADRFLFAAQAGRPPSRFPFLRPFSNFVAGVFCPYFSFFPLSFHLDQRLFHKFSHPFRRLFPPSRFVSAIWGRLVFSFPPYFFPALIRIRTLFFPPLTYSFFVSFFPPNSFQTTSFIPFRRRSFPSQNPIAPSTGGS